MLEPTIKSIFILYSVIALRNPKLAKPGIKPLPKTTPRTLSFLFSILNHLLFLFFYLILI